MVGVAADSVGSVSAIRVRLLLRVAVAMTLAVGGCGDDEKSASPPRTTASAASTSQQYRDQLAPIQQRGNDARSTYHHAPSGETSEITKAARQLARASAALARDVARLRAPPALADVNRRLRENYREQAAEVERELDRKPVSTERLGDIIRKHEKASDDLYQEVL